MSENWQGSNTVKIFSESIVWIPCIPNYATGTLIPIYDLSNCPFPVKKARTTPLISRGGIKSKPWTHEEDSKLFELVNEHGLKQWSSIANTLNSVFGNMRKGKHCRERWYNNLNPEINRGEWSYEEDILLLTQQKTIGNKWSTISKMLTGRTENSVKNRWNSLIKNSKQEMNLSYLSNQAIADILIKELSSIAAKKQE